MFRLALAAFAIIATAGVLSTSASENQLGAAPAITWTTTSRDVAGRRETVETGRLTVPERHAQPNGRTLTLAFVRLKTSAAAPRAPIVYLDGGPGGSGVSALDLPDMAALFTRLRGVGDVILLSQRGTGLSQPRLSCPGTGPLPEDALTSLERLESLLFPKYRACAERFRAAGHDVSAYNTEESADDLDSLRRGLGADRLSLLGFSYGTHLGLAAIRRHSGSLERVVLAGVEGPDETLKLPHVYDEQIDRVAAIAKADPAAGPGMPDLVGALRALLAKVRQAPIAVEIGDGGSPRRVLVGDAGILYILRRDLGDTNDTPWIPAFVYDTLGGDYGLLRTLVGRRLPQLEGSVGLMGLAMDCASGATAERLARIRLETRNSIFGLAVNAPYPEVCDAIGVPALGDAFRAPVVSDVPTLIVSGTLDANTPPAQAEAHRRGLSRSVHLVVANAGHESTLPVPDVQQAIVDFLAGRDVADRTVTLPVPTIRPAAKNVATRRSASPTDFDFLEGTWQVVYNNNTPTIPPDVRGTWTAVRQADGRVLYDEFRLFGPQNETVVLGLTYRVYDRAKERWDMRYVGVIAPGPDGRTPQHTANWSDLTAWREGSQIRVDQEGSSSMLRITYYDIRKDRFSWKADLSTDGGQTWSRDHIRIEARRASQHLAGR